MKKLLQASMLLGCVFSPIAFAAETPSETEVDQSLDNWLTKTFTLSGTLAFTSNYISSGISQTDNDPALQGSLMLQSAYGFYGQVWGSSVNFSDGEGNTAYLESDWYLGYQNDYHGFHYDFGYVYYYYPGSTNLDYGQVYLNTSYSIFRTEVQYSPNAQNQNENGAYFLAGIDVPVAPNYIFGINDVMIGSHVGYSVYSGVLSDEDYVDWEAYVQKTWFDHLQTELAYTDTTDQTGTANHLQGSKLSGTMTVLF